MQRYLSIYAKLVRMAGLHGRGEKERKFNSQLPEIGECVWFLRALSEGKKKLDTRWEDGVFAGVREESREIYVMSDQGVRKVRSYKRRPEGERGGIKKNSRKLWGTLGNQSQAGII